MTSKTSKLPNDQLHPNAQGIYPDRKITKIWNYNANRLQFAIAAKRTQSVTQYLDADGSTFTSLDTDRDRHPSTDILSPSDLETLLSIAVAVPEEAIAMFRELDPADKPQLQAALKTLTTEQKVLLKAAAIGTQLDEKTGITATDQGAIAWTMPAKAITLHRPWAEAIARHGKDIENRNWNCPLKPGDWIAIHAGKTWDSDAIAWIADRFGGKIEISPNDTDHESGIVAIAQFQGNTTQGGSGWYTGSVGWMLTNAIPLNRPVVARGQQGLWNLSDEQKQAIACQLAATEDAIASQPKPSAPLQAPGRPLKSEKGISQPALESTGQNEVAGCHWINLNVEPSWLHESKQENFVYVGREYPRYDLRRSPLANIPMHGKSLGERDRVCNAHVETLIRALEVGSGPTYDELQRLAMWYRTTGHLVLGCWCAPQRCHAEGISVAVMGLADGIEVSAIIRKLRALLPQKQLQISA